MYGSDAATTGLVAWPLRPSKGAARGGFACPSSLGIKCPGLRLAGRQAGRPEGMQPSDRHNLNI
jgi:hypothetical protein